MHILITGGSGLIGRALTQNFLREGHRVSWLSRTTDTRPPEAFRPYADALQVIPWLYAGAEPENRLVALGTPDVVINLAGTSINASRWHKAQKEAILTSRISATDTLLQLLQKLPQRPSIFINASALEASRPLALDIDVHAPLSQLVETGTKFYGLDFLTYVTRVWEGRAAQAKALGMRTIFARFGIVFSREGGALPELVRPVRLYVGGPIAGGHQMLSWIHIADVVGMLQWSIDQTAIDGPLHVAAPEAASNAHVIRTIARLLNRPYWLPVPKALLNVVLGEMSALVTEGYKQTPIEALKYGYPYRFPDLESALKDLFRD
ncbi:MAG: TIGR01777 family oxidoreductase [Candidatus Carbobacillus sp.]|nr:TIGR01777 family oxidoreductase [Candidatus Carbobacillus sp.]